MACCLYDGSACRFACSAKTVTRRHGRVYVCVCVLEGGGGGGICDGHVQVELSCIVCHLLSIRSMLPMLNWLLRFTVMGKQELAVQHALIVCN